MHNGFSIGGIRHLKHLSWKALSRLWCLTSPKHLI